MGREYEGRPLVYWFIFFLETKRGVKEFGPKRLVGVHKFISCYEKTAGLVAKNALHLTDYIFILLPLN